MKPPKMFTEAKKIAKRPKKLDMPDVAPAATMAPTIITLEIAFVTAMSGE